MNAYKKMYFNKSPKKRSKKSRKRKKENNQWKKMNKIKK